MSFRFVHTADIHIDSPLCSLSLRNRELSALIGDSTRQALIAIVELCFAEEVDALIIAGDFYDTGFKTPWHEARSQPAFDHRQTARCRSHRSQRSIKSGTRSKTCSAPTRNGFASRLMRRIVPGYFAGTGDSTYEPAGFRYVLFGSIILDTGNETNAPPVS